jgi:hypothetical protein
MQIPECLSADSLTLEFLATATTEHRAAKLNYSAHISCAQRNKISLDEATISAANTKDLDSAIESGTNDGAHSGIHARRIPAAG